MLAGKTRFIAFKGLTLLLSLLLLQAQELRAQVTLPAIFSDNMVLQQKDQVALWGTAAAGKTVTIRTSWNRKTYRVKTGKKGNWKIKVATPAAGGPYTITFRQKEQLELKNVLIGEVWVCSGQSNMEMSLMSRWGNVNNYQQEIATATLPQIRMLEVEHVPASTPQAAARVKPGAWIVCSPQTAAQFSAVAFFFARSLHKSQQVPIGLIHASWGGTLAEAWTSGPALRKMAAFAPLVNQMETEQPAIAVADEKSKNKVTVLFNGMIRPLIPYAIKGVIWYQGENNVPQAHQYRELFPLLITDWRRNWGQGDFPFYFVQLANYRDRHAQPGASDWAELREAQLRTLALPNTGMAVAIDVGEAKNIHPKNKQAVGERLALLARAQTYGEQVTYSGPLYQSQEVAGGQIRLSFQHAAGLQALGGGAPKGFAVAGADRKFYWAEARIEGSQVVVYSSQVPNPVAVRYAWANNPEATLCNGAGLPASPFRTDHWPGLTSGD